jgi:high-affinity Fe2+/Pb2+ permease
LVQTRKQRERQAASLGEAAYGLALVAFVYGWLLLHSLLAGFLLGFVVVGLTASGLYLLCRRRETALRQAGLGDLEHMNGEQFEELLQARFRAQGCMPASRGQGN